MLPKMKVLYIFIDSTKSLGVIKKVKSKIKLLNNTGIEVEGLFLNKDIVKRDYNSDEKITYVPLVVSELPFFYNRRFIRNYKSYFTYNSFYKKLYKTLTDEVSKKTFDVILFRYPLANKYLYYFAKKFKHKIVFEHNSKELVEQSLPKDGVNSFLYKQEKKYGGKVLQLAKGITGVGKEVTLYELNKSGISNLPHAVISNSIEVISMPLRSVPILNKVNYNYLYLTGSPSPWVGIDIVLKSLSKYKSLNKDIKLYIIGPKSEPLISLVNELRLSDIVFFEGEKKSDELNDYFNFCHVAFGTMAMQRVGLAEHSSLKILEYASRGIPFVVGYDDTNFYENPNFQPFILKLPYNNNIFDFEKVISFTDNVYEIIDHAHKMRELAINTLDTSIKMNELRNFLTTIK
jgi:glycosyltransferase involved in cell wall biosynthesis